MSHSVFDIFTIFRSKSPLTMNAFSTTISALYAIRNSLHSFVSIVTFTKYYYGYVELQDWNRTLTCSGCNAKGQLPRVVSADGTSLLISKEQAKSAITPTDTTRFAEEAVVKMQNFIGKTQIVYINDKQTRNRIRNHIISSDIRQYKLDKEQLKNKRPLNATQTQSLLKSIGKNHSKPYAEFIQWIHNNILSTNIILVEDKMKGLENRKNEMEELDYLRQMNELRKEQSLNLERCKWNIEENGNDNDDNDDNNISDDNEQENANMNIDD
eukprot:224511_1